MNIYYMYYSNEHENIGKADHIAGRELLSWALQKEYGIETLPDIEKNPRGKPYFKNQSQIHFNISHCDGVVACVFSDSEVGIDVEAQRKVRDSLFTKALTEKEQRQLQEFWGGKKEWGFLHYWTLKESFIKAIGKGLSYPLLDVEFEFQQKEKKSFTEVMSNQPEWCFFQTEISSEVILAVCIRKEEMCSESERLCLFQVDQHQLTIRK